MWLESSFAGSNPAGAKKGVLSMTDIILINCPQKINALTRRDIIKNWERNEGYLDYLCCPNCRDLLFKRQNTEKYYCFNEGCKYFFPIEQDDE